jgi:hypothetical protein
MIEAGKKDSDRGLFIEHSQDILRPKRPGFLRYSIYRNNLLCYENLICLKFIFRVK